MGGFFYQSGIGRPGTNLTPGAFKYEKIKAEIGGNMRMHNKGGMQLSSFLISSILIASLAAGAFLTGCSNQDKDIKSDKITKGQYLALQKARKKLGHFIDEMSGAIKSSYPLETRLENVEKVIEKYEEAFPDYNQFYLEENSRPEVAEGTITDDLLNIMYESESGNHETMAYYVPQNYLLAVHTLKGLSDFQQYVLDHTFENGTVSNPENPFEDLQGGYKIFAMYPMHNGVSVNTMIDPSCGAVQYSSEIGVWGEPKVSKDPLGTEYLFIEGARELMKEGDTLLVESSDIEE